MGHREEDIIQVKSDVDSLNKSMNLLVTSISDSVEAQKATSKNVNDLILQMKERSIREEYKEKEIERIKDNAKRVENTLVAYVDSNAEPMQKLIRSQALKESFFASATSSWGKVAAMIVIVGVAYVLGIDLSNLKE